MGKIVKGKFVEYGDDESILHVSDAYRQADMTIVSGKMLRKVGTSKGIFIGPKCEYFYEIEMIQIKEDDEPVECPMIVEVDTLRRYRAMTGPPENCLKPFVTPNIVLKRHAGDPETQNPRLSIKKDKRLEPWDGNKPMNCATDDYKRRHQRVPDGHRRLTDREFGSLHGLPDNYIYEGPAVRKQTNNVVPHGLLEPFLRQVLSQLFSTDKKREEGTEEESD